MTIQIRQATIEDAPDIARLMVDTFLAAHRHQMPEAAWQKRKEEWTYAVSERNWRQTIGKVALGETRWPYTIVALNEMNKLVGLATGQPFGLPSEASQTVGEITSIYIRKDAQKQGIGRRLLQTVARHLAKAGMRSLRIAVLDGNSPARQFYERLGGHKVGEQLFDEGKWMLPEIVYGWDDIHTLMSAKDKLELRGLERDKLLEGALALVQADRRIVTAWLFGSFGRGDADALSDIDLWTAVADAECASICTNRHAYVAQLGEPLFCLESEYNSPLDGAYLMALYPSRVVGLQQVDWYWQPASQARIPDDAKLLFDRVGLSLAPGRVTTSFARAALATPQPPLDQLTPTQRSSVLTAKCNEFWSIVAIAAKYLARRESPDVAWMEQQVAELRYLVGTEDREVIDQDAFVATWQRLSLIEQLGYLQDVAKRIEQLTSAIEAKGGVVPVRGIKPVFEFFEFVASLLDE